ncbi:COX15/CtaA family protein [Spirosoma sp. KUDC1026]|uniref:COX15/CtaA family protein n=1 Tax=Spirosoma sp. KUDC1026 TaxID=2745947 RepID=UPI00159BD9C2|nr:COX15/CtaA family protein [Spirosoma sp. KUDC1026]QKZ11478.1 COX15/CtaA family protein [Spirosoma sp. KUDC1026]
MTNSSNLTNSKKRRFRTLAFLTVILIYLLVLAGGIVRGTGSGMGCPDWPKCFGLWIPPTHISQLPANYQEIYGAKLKGEVEFNATKTWIEYVNRLIGALTGFVVFVTLIASLIYLKTDKSIVLGSFAAFFLVGLNGWLGAKVVSTELAQYLITIHFLLAIFVVFALLYVFVRADANTNTELSKNQYDTLSRLLVITLLVSIIQIVLGTQVRTALDQVVKQLGYNQRMSWVDNLDWRFYVHRSFSILVLALHIAVIYQIRKVSKGNAIHKLGVAMMAIVIAEITSGIIMAYGGVPAAMQPIHLLLAVVMIGLQYTAWLRIIPQSKQIESQPETISFQRL